MFELAQYGLPAILIPYPHASADHQTANARWMAERRRRRRSCPTPSSARSGSRAEVGELLGEPERLARDGRARRAAWRGRTPPQAVAREVLAAAADAR